MMARYNIEDFYIKAIQQHNESMILQENQKLLLDDQQHQVTYKRRRPKSKKGMADPASYASVSDEEEPGRHHPQSMKNNTSEHFYSESPHKHYPVEQYQKLRIKQASQKKDQTPTKLPYIFDPQLQNASQTDFATPEDKIRQRLPNNSANHLTPLGVPFSGGSAKGKGSSKAIQS